MYGCDVTLVYYLEKHTEVLLITSFIISDPSICNHVMIQLHFSVDINKAQKGLHCGNMVQSLYKKSNCHLVKDKRMMDHVVHDRRDDLIFAVSSIILEVVRKYEPFISFSDIAEGTPNNFKL